MDKKTLEKALELHEEWLEMRGMGKRLDLRDADLRYADLRDVNLRDSNLRYADLRRADLRYADLRYADLRYADLRDADLRDADLRYAKLTGTDLVWANTQDVKGQKVVSVQVDTTRKNNLITYWADLGIWTTGCFQGSLEKLKESIESTHKDNEFMKKRYCRVIDFILNEVKEDEIGR